MENRTAARTMIVAAAVTALTLHAACVNDVEGEHGAAMGAGDLSAASTSEQAFTARCASGSTVKGIDVSYYQGNIDWTRVKNDGVRYAFIRVSDGTGFLDPKFEANWRNAKDAGVLRGAYQFFRADDDPEDQADLLVSKMGPLRVGDLPPVIDVESSDGKSASTIRNRVRRWVDRVESRTGIKPIIYTGPYFWRDQVGGDFDDHKLWIAHYGTSCPYVPPTWSKWTFHQHTSSGSVNGIGGNVDMNKFDGTFAQLHALTYGGDLPRACVDGGYDGAFCDDERHGNEAFHDRLVGALDVDFHCADVGGSPAYCPTDEATRAQAVFVLGRAARIPLEGHPDAFDDDESNARERYLNAGAAYGVIKGYDDGAGRRDARPDTIATRTTLAVLLTRMYALPPVTHDYFDDDDDSSNETYHNRVAAAGLIIGHTDRNGGRRDFDGNDKATRSTLAVVAVRAHDKGLVPVWQIPDACLEGSFAGSFCDDDASPGAATIHDRLTGELGVNLGGSLSCTLAGEPAFCGSSDITRADAMFILGKAADVPLAGHPDAFDDDDDHARETYLNAAHVFGVFTGYGDGSEVKPDLVATRDTLAIMLTRMYALPPTSTDFFSDDDDAGAATEDAHNRAAAAGLFTGYDDGNGGREFRGDKSATRHTVATLAVRAADAALDAVW